jgi:cysteine/O-acetylserine efflux protein
MDVDFFGLVVFVCITTFTPGPNNITSASMGIRFGYRHTLRYLGGIVVGFFLIMLLCALGSTVLLQVFPDVRTLLQVVGAAYILWLAFHTLRSSYTFEEDQQVLFSFSHGFFLQLLNPKLLIYGLTLYSGFLAGIGTHPAYLFASALVFTGIGFLAISTWTLVGSSIRRYLDRPKVKGVLNTVLALLLVYTAIELSGALAWVS